MSGKEDSVRGALSGFSLYTLGDEHRQGNSIAVKGRELERYEVGPATIILANEDGIGRYVAVEPHLTERERDRLSGLLDHLFMTISPEDSADPSKRLISNMVEAARSLGFLDEVTHSLQIVKRVPIVVLSPSQVGDMNIADSPLKFLDWLDYAVTVEFPLIIRLHGEGEYEQ